MCGRFTLTRSIEELVEEFDLPADVLTSEITPRYNIAPTQSIHAIVAEQGGGRGLRKLHWGLVPSWAKDPSIGAKMINARAETLAEKPSFKTAFRTRRCLIPVDGFYEWKKINKAKQPYYIRMMDESVFAFAGLYEHWQGSDSNVIDSCTIITTEPNALMADLHHRMPVIISRDDYALWLDPSVQQPTELQTLLQLCQSEKMTAYPVSTLVNRATNETDACIEPAPH